MRLLHTTALFVFLAAARPEPNLWAAWPAAWLQGFFALLKLPVELDPEALDMLGGLRSSLQNLDLESFYHRLESDQVSRSLFLTGTPEAELYRLERGRRALGDGLGSLGVEVRLRPDPLPGIEGTGYDLDAILQVQLGSYRWRHPVEFAALALETFEVQGAALAPLRRDFPSTLEFWESLFEVREAVGAGGWTWNQSLRGGALGRRAPHLGKFIERLGSLGQLRWEIGLEGRLVASGTLWTEGLRSEVHLQATAERLRALLEPGEASGWVAGELCLSDRGLRSCVGPLRAELIWKRETSRSDLLLTVVQTPASSIEGRAFRVLPLSLIDALLPGDLEGLLARFAATLQGSRVHWLQEEGVLTLELNGRILDNGLLQLGLRLFGRRFRMGSKSLHEFSSLGRELLSALEQDWRKSLEEPR